MVRRLKKGSKTFLVERKIVIKISMSDLMGGRGLSQAQQNSKNCYYWWFVLFLQDYGRVSNSKHFIYLKLVLTASYFPGHLDDIKMQIWNWKWNDRMVNARFHAQCRCTWHHGLRQGELSAASVTNCYATFDEHTDYKEDLASSPKSRNYKLTLASLRFYHQSSGYLFKIPQYRWSELLAPELCGILCFIVTRLLSATENFNFKDHVVKENNCSTSSGTQESWL